MTWRNVLACGLVASAAIAGCTVTAGSGSGPDGSILGTGGSTSTGGVTATGGKDGGKGGTAAGGATSAGGAAAGGSTADAQVTSCAGPYDNSCDGCIETKCCAEWLDCANDKDCGKTSEGELYCIQRCLLGDVADASSGGPDPGACANSCAHSNSIIADATNALIICIRAQKADAGPQNCSTACFNAELP
jgi:hypothetical protein